MTARQSDGNVERKKMSNRPKSDIVHLQPTDTGTGVNVNTQLVYANKMGPMMLQELAILTRLPLETDEALLERFKNHDRVIYNEETGLFSYRNDFNVHDKTALLLEIRHHTLQGGGLPIRILQQSWEGAPAAINELEKEGQVIILHTQMEKMVFWNEVRAPEPLVDDDLRSLWHSLVVPTDTDIHRDLETDGLQATQGATHLSQITLPKTRGSTLGPHKY